MNTVNSRIIADSAALDLTLAQMRVDYLLAMDEESIVDADAAALDLTLAQMRVDYLLAMDEELG